MIRCPSGDTATCTARRCPRWCRPFGTPPPVSGHYAEYNPPPTWDFTMPRLTYPLPLVYHAPVAEPKAQQGCFPPDRPDWCVALHSFPFPILRVSDADDQEYQVTGPPQLLMEIAAMLCGTGPLSARDIQEVLQDYRQRRNIRWL